MTQVKLVRNEKTRKQKLMRKCDQKRSVLVKKRAWWKCEVDGCNKDSYLNAHHLFSRVNWNTRYDIDNGICLCAGHHTMSSNFSAHKTPLEFAEWVINKKWKERYDNMKRKSKMLWDKDYDKVMKYLEDKEQEINEMVKKKKGM